MSKQISELVTEVMAKYRSERRRIDSFGRFVGHNLARLRGDEPEVREFTTAIRKEIGCLDSLPEDPEARAQYLQGYFACARDVVRGYDMQREYALSRNPMCVADILVERPFLLIGLMFADGRGKAGFVPKDLAADLGPSDSGRYLGTAYALLRELSMMQLVLAIPSYDHRHVIYGMGPGVAAILKRRGVA